VQLKTEDKDGYKAAQLGFVPQKEQRMKKAALSRFKAANVTPCRLLREFKVEDGDEVSVGDSVTASIFEDVTHVDVIATTKGRGFQGVVKRYNMAGGRMTHGGHSKRRVGSIGQCSYPANVAKNQRMPGHMGNVTVTTQNLKVVGVRPEENLILVKGSVPGPNGGIVLVNKALKKGTV
jgi:large subunit ribosomal protein L3